VPQPLSVVILVGGLIFVHELGHFMWAKIFRVKVLRFSLGFGPALLTLKRGETEYVIAAIPFGGFVRMLGDDSRDPLTPEEEKRALHKQPLWKRFVIIFAGPMMNVVFPVFAFFAVFLGHTELRAASVGVVVPGRPAARGGLMPGDRILAVDGEPAPSFPEVQEIIRASAGRRLRLTVERDGKKLPRPLVVVPRRAVDTLPLDVKRTIGRVDFMSAHPAPIIAVPDLESPAGRAGLRTFDLVTDVDGRKVPRRFDLERVLASARGDQVRIGYLRPERVDVGFAEIALFSPGTARVAPDAGPDGRVTTGIETGETYVWWVPEGSPEWRAGLRTGDRIVGLDGHPITLWGLQLREALATNGERTRTLAFVHEGRRVEAPFRMEKRVTKDEVGQTRKRFVFRTTNLALDAPDETVPNDDLLAYAAKRSIRQTGEALQVVAIGVVRLFQGKLSFRAVGGPLTLYDIAGKAAEGGASQFLFIMALISIQLAIINLLPVPVLDGGHILFIACEAVLRRPLSLRTREIASMVGLSLILLLMVFVIRNDIEHYFFS
jgi:regulator of sigma E protease